MLKVSLHKIAILFFGLAAGLVCHATVVEDLYSAEVAVANKSQQALNVGSRDALAEVLVKISGSVEVLHNPVLLSALENAQNLVQQYAYTRQEGESSELLARFEFDASIVSGLFAKAGVPLWTANRPPVLVWMVMEGLEGRQFLSWESSPEMMLSVTGKFARRGVPVQFPLYDLNDAAAISVDEAWGLNAISLSSASQRYDVQDVLAGRLASLSNGSWVGDWSYFSGTSRVDRSIQVGDAETFLQAGVSLVAEELSARYAVAPSSTVSEGVKILVSGVSSYTDYASIVAWLEGLELIESANIEQIRGETIRLNLLAQADAGQLAVIIELNKRLLPVQSPDSTILLSYQWMK